MRKQLPRLLMIGALLAPSALYALGLGELKLNSALNQPFDAEIELIAPTSDELAELKVALANNEAFARYGLDRPAYLSNFEFAVTRNRDGRSAIKVTSNSSVTEPFVTLLVEVVSGRGRLLREYTVLLDPPVLMPSQPESTVPVTPPQSGPQNDTIDRGVPSAEVQPTPEPVIPTPAAEPTPASEPVVAATQDAPPAEPPPEQVAGIVPTPTPEPVAPIENSAPLRVQEPTPTPPQPQQQPGSAGGSYVVQRNDTLFRIARDVRPDATKTRQINQTMIALFRANPDAFRAENINQLRAGSVLRLPDGTEIEAIPATEASAEVRRQAQAWRGSLPQTARMAAGDRLRLVAPPEAPSSGVVATPKQPADTASGRPGAEPTGGDKRVALGNQSLANVQKNLDDQRRPTPPPQPAIVEQPPQTLQTQPAPEPEVAVTPPEEQPPPLAEPAPLPAANQPSLIDRAADFWWVPIVVGLAVLLVGLAAAFLRRRSREPDLGDALDAPPLTFEPRIANELQQNNRMRNRGDAFAVPPAPDPREEETAFGGERDRPTVFREEPVARSIEPVAPPVSVAKPKVVPPPQPKSVEDTLSSETAVRFDQQDALAEADFHMAYGLYDQAADLVKIAIDREPNRRDLKLKLLEIYFVWGNRDLFLETANELHQTRDRANAGEWENILIMGRQIAPEEPMFKGDGGRVDLVDVNLEGGENRVDVDLFAAPEASQSDGLDLEFASGERSGPGSDLDYLLDETREERSREYDPLSRTQETPTIESPVLESGQTSRMRALNGGGRKAAARAGYEETARSGLRDDERTQLAPSLGNLDRTMLAPDNAIYIDQVDLNQGGDTIEQRRPGRQANGNGYDEQRNDTFADDVFANGGGTNRFERIDLDVGDSLATEDRTATRQSRTSMELSELEPVTMSEVGTKLDLARAYMDMGDPDGARSILEEVVEEGNVSQKQEAQRLLESVR